MKWSLSEENMACDAPHVVYEIRIEEVHRPSLPFRRKAAEHKYPGPLRQERLKGMFLSLYVFCFHANKDTTTRPHTDRFRRNYAKYLKSNEICGL